MSLLPYSVEVSNAIAIDFRVDIQPAGWYIARDKLRRLAVSND